MKDAVRWLLFYVLAAMGIWLLALALILGGLALQFKALVMVLQPMLGAAAAYSLTGLACFLLLATPCLLMWIGLRRKAQRPAPAASAEAHDPYGSAAVLVKKYPLESVAIAFAAGFSANDREQLQSLLATVAKNAEEI
ncbi:hypothetical protein EUZ85_05310 [Hahella sp. KA22]|uniref:hypothetical protein n=1 Tax=Hahella sp. KA22 TaxID=1628392 RepID=UPI000FDE3615|nr:hypothetical protein [Hahella sp. KA22]AZZ90159.1 hypothetical protein ENC22_02760 [Hahella sp. KA22]QAY53529.1 hypothetical protein EUZ85_05310 [Hahella sp. KA22]